ncbi:MarR family winged helix-turn-helix transcriptional regulator [Streptomyces sp. NPDC046887]|uniref:MarR family winged helix-turn-helix transcriptional regulator n=1 Tax=Streptomyces sp. NPDC046887 TaxID=3155472 RepID=UPI003411360E
MHGSDTPPASFPPNGPTDPVGLQGFAVLLRRMNAEFNRIAQEFAQAHGLHLTDVQALIAILDAGARPGGDGDDEGPMTPGRLRRRLNLTSGAMTACLDRLERSGHVHRVRASDDRRVVHLHYAEAARELARDYFQPLARSTDAARAHFTRAELLVVVRFLDAMNEELDRLRR